MPVDNKEDLYIVMSEYNLIEPKKSIVCHKLVYAIVTEMS